MRKKGEKEKDGKKVNFYELIAKSLSYPRMTLDYSGFQFTVLNLSGKNLYILSPLFKDFKYVEHIDLSNNALLDITLRTLKFKTVAPVTNLITLNVYKNNIKDLKALNVEDSWKNLRVINLNFNKIVEMIPISAPALTYLHLEYNKIYKVYQFTGHPKLRVLRLRGNKIGPLQGLSNMPELRYLCLAENKVKSLAGLDGVPNLQKLSFRKNNITAFDETFPMMENLTDLNIAENNIGYLAELFKLKDLPKLQNIIVTQNPVLNKYQASYFWELLNSNLRLQSINEQPISKGIKLRAFKYSEEKWKAAELKKREEEYERKRKEDAEKPPEES